MTHYQTLLHTSTLERIGAYRTRLISQGLVHAGQRLQRILQGRELASLDDEQFLECLMNTRMPMIFAESAVHGDGSDWTLEELALMGDIGMATDVEIFDNGRHHAPNAHQPTFRGTLLFIPGALLRNGTGNEPADAPRVIRSGRIDPEGYQTLYEHRLLPLLHYAGERATQSGRKAFITLPGLGCGQFAGRFQGQMGEHLKTALLGLLRKHARNLPGISAIYYDPYAECGNERHRQGKLDFLVRPLTQGNENKPQLCRPAHYQETGDDFSHDQFFSIVAWDHVSWPGNDFYGGSRTTDDGVKAAATDVMRVMTGIEGHYDKARAAYLPPDGYRNWSEVVNRQQTGMNIAGHVHCFG